MTQCGNDAKSPFSKTICSICYEDLKPTVEDIQSISICGHVFHELCIQQWFEYCSKGKKCPVCKQTCSSSSVSRLYFQSVGDTEPKLSQKPQTHEKDPEELHLEVRRLEGKVKGLNSTLESRQNDLNNISDELSMCKELLKKEGKVKNEALEQIRIVNRLLHLKTEELNKSDLECIRLQERNMALAKELAALKLVSDLNLEEEDILKLATLGTNANSKETIDILKKSLVIRNKMYKELITKCNTLGRDEARSRKNLEKAKEKTEKLKARIHELETANEIKDNEVLRSLKTFKNTNLSSNVQNTVNHTLVDTHTLEDKTKQAAASESALEEIASMSTGLFSPIKTKRPRSSEDMSLSTNTNNINASDQGISSYIVIDDDAPDVLLDHEMAQDKTLPDITKDASLPVLGSQEAGDLCFSGGLLGPDGTNRHLGKWCKRSQINGLKPLLVPTQGDLIAVGADGRGGTIKVLRSHNSSSSDNNGRSTGGKNGKFVAKKSSLQSQGCLQIDHFFRKTDR